LVTHKAEVHVNVQQQVVVALLEVIGVMVQTNVKIVILLAQHALAQELINALLVLITKYYLQEDVSVQLKLI